MLKIGVLVSGGGTNLQAILDAIDAGEITNAKVDIVISNNASAYALERARKHDIEAVCIAPKDYPDREAFHKALLAGELPYTIGGGIGQSRLCMLLLGSAHIGEVQSSVWDHETRTACAIAGIPLL